MKGFFILILFLLTIQPSVFQQLKTATLKAVSLNKLNTTQPLSFKCLFNTDFECLNKQKCIRLSQVCDKTFDCNDRSDEFNCNFCNQTFVNDESSEKFTIRSPIAFEAKTFCHYKIVNVKNATVIGVRLKKFNVGKLNTETGLCEDAWLDFYEDDDHDSKPISSRFIIVKAHRISLKVYLNLAVRKFVKSSRDKRGRKKVGRFCGTLYDMYSNYYAHGKVLQILFYASTSNFTGLFNNDSPSSSLIYEFEFDIIFHPSNLMKTLANENSFTHKASAANLTASKNSSIRRTFYNGVLIDGTQCNRLYNDCYKNNDNDSYACIINSPGFPGIYAKDLQCLFYIRKSSPSETFIIINSFTNVDSKVCLNKNLNKNQYKSYQCESRLVVGSDDCKDYLNIYNGPSTSDSMVLAENICGNGILPKIITKSDSFLFKFKSSSDGLFANTGFVFHILSEKQYFEYYDNFNKRIFNNDISNVNQLKSIQKLDKLQIQNCDSFKNECSINLMDDDDTNGHLFSLNQYHMKNFTLKYLLKAKEFNSIGIFVENYFLSKCGESYLSIEAIENSKDTSLIAKFCNQQGQQEEHAVSKKLFFIDNNYDKDILITHYKLNQVFDASKLYDFKIYFEYFNLQWNIFLKDSICNYVINAENDTTLIRDHIINPQADIFYKYNTLDCKYKLIAAKNQYIKLVVNEINFNNDNCNENIFASNETELEFEEKCSKINAKITIRELDVYFTSMNETSTVLRACLCKKVGDRKVFISQRNYIEISYSVKLSQFGSSNLKQNRFNITYKFMNRNCNNRQTPIRGSFEYNINYGVQREFLIPGYTRNLLYPGNFLNRNYYCKYSVHAPNNSFVYAEFTELRIPSNDCELDYIKVFSIYKLHLMKLCKTKQLLENERNFPFLNLKEKQLFSERNLVVNTEFTNEKHRIKILNCYDNTQKLCFTSSDLIHDSHRANRILDGVANKISFEIFASNIANFTFKIRYHFYTLDKESVNKTYKNDGCDFKCSSKAIVLNNTFLNMCLSKQLRCDGTVDCIYTQDDELDCPKFSNVILTIIILASVFAFVALVFFMIVILRRMLIVDPINVQYKKAELKH